MTNYTKWNLASLMLIIVGLLPYYIFGFTKGEIIQAVGLGMLVVLAFRKKDQSKIKEQ